jgi:hypothetical protein
MLFWWYIYVTTFRPQSAGGTCATRGCYFSVRGYDVQSEPSEPTGTPVCFWRKLGLLLMCSRCSQPHPWHRVESPDSSVRYSIDAHGTGAAYHYEIGVFCESVCPECSEDHPDSYVMVCGDSHTSSSLEILRPPTAYMSVLNESSQGLIALGPLCIRLL